MTDGSANGGGPTKGIGRDAVVAPRPRRFYKAVTVSSADTGFGIALDGRAARSPGKRQLVVPSRPLAQAVAAEWEAQGDEILAETMPLTRLVNTVIDGVVGNEPPVRADIVAFAGSDLVCYRAGSPAGLAAAQSAAWDPVLTWARETLGATFATCEGIMHVAQPDAAIARISAALDDLDAWHLTPLHQITTLTGSALIALAHLKGALSVDEAWRAAHVDEDWQVSRWGEDSEAAARRAQRWGDMQAASSLVELLHGRS